MGMKAKRITLIVWSAVALSLVAWTGVVMFALAIQSQKDASFSHVTDADAALARESAALRLHALSRDTKDARAQLDELVQADFLAIADTIEGVGKISGVKIKIGGAAPESGQQPQALNSPALNAVDFVVEAEGSFAKLMHTVALFETLPVLSSIQNLELERVSVSSEAGASKKAAWRLSGRIKVLTTHNISP